MFNKRKKHENPTLPSPCGEGPGERSHMKITLINQFVLEKLPKTIHKRDYLAEKFSISKESAYRRLKGEVPFSFEEVVAMTLDFNFSVDDIIQNIHESNAPRAIDKQKGQEKSFLNLLREYHRFFHSVSNSQELELTFSMDRIRLFFLLEYDNLFRWFYHKWMLRMKYFSIRQPFSNTVVPAEIQHIRKELKAIKGNLSQLSFISSKDLFFSIVHEIQYYHERRLLTDAEVLLLKEELKNLLNSLEYKMVHERGKGGNDFFLSELDVETDSIYALRDGLALSLYWLHSLKIQIVDKQRTCEEHIQWLKSIKETSALISRSNELLRMDFLETQRKTIDEL
jgi:hypothetical protein